MAYDYLTMCNNVSNNAGVSGRIATVVGQTGTQGRITRYVREACIAVESKWTDWKFMWGGLVPLELQAGTAVYTPPNTFDLFHWGRDRMAVNGIAIPPENVFLYADYIITPSQMTDQGYPGQVIIQPDNSLRFISVPDVTYEFIADYYRQPTTLALDTDVPRVPAKYLPLIEAIALMKYAKFDNAEELMLQAQGDIDLWMPLLEQDQRPGGEPSGQSYGNNITIVAT